jgi:hypothetical protein
VASEIDRYAVLAGSEAGVDHEEDNRASAD